MNHKRMYALSTALHQFQKQLPEKLVLKLLELHAYRYKFFIDSSPRGRHCRYAILTIEHYINDDEATTIKQWLCTLPYKQNILELL